MTNSPPGEFWGSSQTGWMPFLKTLKEPMVLLSILRALCSEVEKTSLKKKKKDNHSKEREKRDERRSWEEGIESPEFLYSVELVKRSSQIFPLGSSDVLRTTKERGKLKS